jgi:ADP-ribosyl-[dinitrogen reductase] hydrolase
MNACDRRDRIRGCLLGGAIGDALGAPVEFKSRAAILAEFGAHGMLEFAPAYGRRGAITDDTQMTLFTAEGMLRAYVRWSSKGIVDLPTMLRMAYLRWLQTQDLVPAGRAIDASGWLLQQRGLHARRAPGRTCVTALQSPGGIGDKAENFSKGCGSVMRVAPIGLWCGEGNRVELAFEQACMAAAITHGHASGQLASGAFAAIVAELLRGRGLDASVDSALALLQRHAGHHEVTQALFDARALAARGEADPDAVAELGQGWVAEEALAIGLYCTLTARDIDSALGLAVSHDGDSDSTGSIAGQLLGVIHGEGALPPRWLAQLELADMIRQVADDLHDVHALDWQHDNPAARAFEARYPGY